MAKGFLGGGGAARVGGKLGDTGRFTGFPCPARAYKVARPSVPKREQEAGNVRIRVMRKFRKQQAPMPGEAKAVQSQGNIPAQNSLVVG